MLVIRGKQPLSVFNWFVNNLEIIYRIKLHLSEKVLFNTNDFIVSQTFYVFILITYLLIVMNAINNQLVYLYIQEMDFMKDIIICLLYVCNISMILISYLLLPQSL